MTVEQLGIGRLEVGDVGGRIAHHEVAADAAAGGACAIGLRGHQIEVLAGQGAAHAQHEGVLRSRARLAQLDGHGCARNLAESGVDRSLNLRLAGIARDYGRGVGLSLMGQAQAIALAQGLLAQHHPLLLQAPTDTGLHRAHLSAGLGQGAGVEAELIQIFAGQAADELNVQTQAAGVGLRRVKTDLDIARAHRGQARQLGLHAGGQGHTVARITDVAAGLATQAEREAAAGGGLAVAQGHRQRIKVLAQERPAKAQLVVPRLAAGDLDRAVLAQHRIERVAHRSRVGAVVDAGGGIGFAAMHQAEREAAGARGLEHHFLHLGLARAAILLMQVAEGAGLADHAGTANVLTGQATHKLHQISVARAFVAGVERDLNVAGSHRASAGGEHLLVRGFELGYGLGRVFGVAGVLPGGGGHRLVEQVELEALEAEGVGEGDAVALIGGAA